MPALLLGYKGACDKKIWVNGETEWKGDLITVAMSSNVEADYHVVLDENNGFKLDMFEDETFDEIGCYFGLEHWGIEGDLAGFFKEFAEYWRILKPNGTMGIIIKTGSALNSYPEHIRFFHPNHFGMLTKEFSQSHKESEYACDYHGGWFNYIFMQHELDTLFVYLEKVNPT